jgi:hypothetical protein
MRAWRIFVLGAALALGGCGKTDEAPNPASGSGGQGGGAQGGSATAGSGTTAGSGGSTSPDGSLPPAHALSKLDLLLMVDNSMNMVVKQQLLSDAMKWLLGTTTGTPAVGASDIHIGVITSSIGAHGATGARDVCVNPDDDDHAHLLGQVRPGLNSFQNTGFLAWATGTTGPTAPVADDLDAMLNAAGEQGCGYESSLEAWYRFLIDPAPPASVVVTNNIAARQGVDNVILMQRQAFLRPDSVVAVVTLSDENDCSIVDDGFGWLIHRAEPLNRSTSVCATNPNDPCCQSCGEPKPNAGCPVPSSDASCAQGLLMPADDDLNLRCYEQKRRFGVDLLQPISRYVNGLTRQMVPDQNGAPVENPLFAGHQRHPSQVLYASIVGVPWQDIADAASLTGPGLTFMTPAELTAGDRWKAILGDASASPPLGPSDPFMIETPVDRSTLSSVKNNPFVNESIAPSTATNPQANHINGHEHVNVGRELQAACTFPLEKPQTCDDALNHSGKGCRCFVEDAPFNRAVCQPPGGGAPTITQSYELAYPGLRHIELTQRLGNVALLGSICPKVGDKASNDYGYRPTLRALAAAIDKALKP